MLKGAISIDLDTLNTHLKGFGLKKEKYDFFDFSSGIDNFLKLLDEFNIKATFFVVGKDLLHQQNIETLFKVVESGHEIANHSMNHIQDFRLLDKKQKTEEIQKSEELIFEKINKRTVGFRTPGWNISDDVIDILKSRNYLYDSSIFPSFLNPVLKFLHFTSMRGRGKIDRTTLGKLKYSFAPSTPYFPARNSFLRKDNNSKFIEFPISVTLIFRFPFFATFLLKTGSDIFKVSYQLMKLLQKPIIYEFHLFDFVDFEKLEFKNQIPKKSEQGVYIPQSIHTSFEKKWNLFHEAMSIMTKDYEFDTLENLAKHYLHKNDSEA